MESELRSPYPPKGEHLTVLPSDPLNADIQLSFAAIKEPNPERTEPTLIRRSDDGRPRSWQEEAVGPTSFNR
jgi:hypothetical protein